MINVTIDKIVNYRRSKLIDFITKYTDNNKQVDYKENYKNTILNDIEYLYEDGDIALDIGYIAHVGNKIIGLVISKHNRDVLKKYDRNIDWLIVSDKYKNTSLIEIFIYLVMKDCNTNNISINACASDKLNYYRLGYELSSEDKVVDSREFLSMHPTEHLKIDYMQNYNFKNRNDKLIIKLNYSDDINILYAILLILGMIFMLLGMVLGEKYLSIFGITGLMLDAIVIGFENSEKTEII